MENQRTITLLYALAGLAGGFLVYRTGTQVVAYGHFTDPLLAGVLPVSGLVGVVAGIGTFLALFRNAQANEFVSSALDELAHVTWPTREETTSNAGIVIGAALGLGLLMFVYDTGWSWVVTKTLYGGAGQ